MSKTQVRIMHVIHIRTLVQGIEHLFEQVDPFLYP